MTAHEIAAEPPVGSYLAQLLDGSGDTPDSCFDVVRLLPEQGMRRCGFLFRDPADPVLATFAPLFDDPGFRRYTVGALTVCRLREVCLLGTDAVLTYGGRVLCDTLYHITHWAPGSVVAEYRQAEYLRLRSPLRVSRVVLGDCLIGFTASWRNYAHWMQESLPKLFLFRQWRQERPGLRLVLPAFARHSFQQQTLDLLGIGPEAVEPVADGEVLAFASVSVIGNVDLWGVPPLCHAAARDLASAAEVVVPLGVLGPERLYIHRAAPPRQVVNASEVRACVERHGFAWTSFEGMRLAEQIATVRGARLVIGEHGAGLVNLLFCPPGARILELFNPACVQPAFWSLASACGSGFGYMVGHHVPRPDQPAPGWNTDYAVPVERLEEAIATLVAG